jgi:hypothetical protein
LASEEFLNSLSERLKRLDLNRSIELRIPAAGGTLR